MQIDHLLVDEIAIDSASLVGVVKSTLYDFRQPRWVSVHQAREGHPIGPITLLKENEESNNDRVNISARSFGERKLSTLGSPASPTISFTDTWTVPDLTLYTLVLPTYFVTTQLKIERETPDRSPTLQIGMGRSRQLFYYVLFADWKSKMHVFRIETRLEKDERRYEELANAVDTVQGTNQFQDFRNAVRRNVLTPEFWFKLLELGAKFVGH